MFKKEPKLTVVGAGPGDTELITIKATKVLATADVVLYDALVNEELLDYVNPTAELIFVGKRSGCYHYQQDQINELIVARGHSHGHVVRLKGGDPFIFGRGAEEMEYAASFGLKTAVVEKAELGGICLNWGCIPTKALLKSANVFEYINHASDYGLSLIHI